MTASRLTKLKEAASALSLDEMQELAAWLKDRIEEAQEEAAALEIPQSPRRLVVEERRTPAAVYRLELVNCGKDRCRKCSSGPAHGPYWYAYWWEGGKTRSQYIGKELPGTGSAKAEQKACKQDLSGNQNRSKNRV